MEALQNAAVISAETPVVLAAIPRNCLRDGVGLIEFTARCRVVQSTERCEADSRQPPVKRIARNPAYPRTARSRNVRYVRIQVGCRNMIVVVVHAENIRDTAFSIGPPRAGVEPLGVRSSRERGERVHDIARVARPVQSKINIVLRTPPASSPSAGPTGAYEERAGAWSDGLP